jgi:crotonobetainyl-CoA:carnitine CoA-transferase CaiB-like acyl-CoA transferase
MPAPSPDHVLAGYKVLDFTQLVAGPTVTRLMAEMGAEVIKVELTPNGDHSRHLPFVRDGRSAYFVQQNRGKKSLCVDLKTAAGARIVRELAAKVDVMVENFAPGVIKRMGFDYETIHALNPRLVMCSISLLGQTGPMAHKPGYDHIAAAYAGVIDMTGFPGESPVFTTMAMGDVSTGVHALSAVLAALLYRERSGKGQWVDLSLVDTYFHYHDLNVQLLSASRGAKRPGRNGPHHYLICPAGIFKSKQGYVFIAALDQQWPRLCNAIGRPEWATQARFTTGAKRAEHAPEIIGTIERWLQEQPSDEHSMAILDDARVPIAPVLSVEQAVNHPHLRARRTVRKINDRLLGEFDVPGFPLRFSEFPQELALEAPLLGEHNAEVLGQYLGYSAGQISELEEAGVIRQDDH